MLTPLHDVRRYACPGETGDVSRSVHLARLAAGYGPCRHCLHRRDAGSLPVLAAVPESSPAESQTPDGLRRTPAGVRGVYLNQLGRTQAIPWAAALASLLWDEQPPILITGEETDRPTDVPPRPAPLVIVGYDERPAAPDLLAGAVMGLARMSCQVIEIGLTTEPCLRFAVQHLQADAGLLITGAGSDPAGIGFDVVRRFGLPPDAPFLSRWFEASQAPFSRPSRSAGRLQAFSPVMEYEQQLSRRFHALRPLHAVCGATSQQVLRRLERLAARLPGRLTTVRLPQRIRDLSDPDDADVQRIGQSVCEHAAQLGLVIDEDGAACSVLDEQGRLIPAPRLHELIIDHLLCEEPGGSIVLSTHVWDELAPGVTARNGSPVLSAEADRAPRLLAERAIAAFGTDHRLWLGGDWLLCDAIATLALVLQLLSRSDAEFSRLSARAPQPT